MGTTGPGIPMVMRMVMTTGLGIPMETKTEMMTTGPGIPMEKKTGMMTTTGPGIPMETKMEMMTTGPGIPMEKKTEMMTTGLGIPMATSPAKMMETMVIMAIAKTPTTETKTYTETVVISTQT